MGVSRYFQGSCTKPVKMGDKHKFWFCVKVQPFPKPRTVKDCVALGWLSKPVLVLKDRPWTSLTNLAFGMNP